MKKIIIFCLLASLVGCKDKEKESYPVIGSIERIDPALDSIVSPGANAEIIASGMKWAEGPLWVEKYNMLLFSDVPRDTIYKWTEKNGKEVYLTPSGYTDTIKRGGEMGSNGLTLDNNGSLILCQCGNRQIGKMDAPLDAPVAKYIALSKLYNGKKFNSPNDVICNSKGEIFFTDPPYGLEKQMDDPKKEMPYQGVFRIKTNGETSLLVDSLTRPNGIAFLPGEKTLLISNSDPNKPNWYAYDIGNNDSLVNPRIFFTSPLQYKSLPGLPDGMKVDKKGNVFAAGPGGIFFFDKNGKLLGKLKLPDASSNCSLSADEKTLYVTNNSYVLRLKMR